MSINSEKRIIITANLASATAAILLNIALAGYLHHETSSAILAASVIVMAYLPPLFLGPRLGSWIDHALNKRRLMSCEFFAACLSLLGGCILVFKAPISILLLLMAVRSLAGSAVRTSMSKWLKLITPVATQSRIMQMFQVSVLVALILSGVAAGIATQFGTYYVEAVVALDISLYVLSISIFSFLPAKPTSTVVAAPIQESSDSNPSTRKVKHDHISTYKEIFSQPPLGRFFLAGCFGQAFFQAAEQIVVSVFGNVGAGISMAMLQIGAGIGLLMGLAIVWRFPAVLDNKNNEIPTRMAITFFLGFTFLIVSTQSHGIALPFSTFLLAIMIYELIDLYSYSKFFQFCPNHSMARYSLSLNTLSGALMSVTVLIYALLIDSFGFQLASLIYIIGGAVLIFCIACAFRIHSFGNVAQEGSTS